MKGAREVPLVLWLQIRQLLCLIMALANFDFVLCVCVCVQKTFKLLMVSEEKRTLYGNLLDPTKQVHST